MKHVFIYLFVFLGFFVLNPFESADGATDDEIFQIIEEMGPYWGYRSNPNWTGEREDPLEEAVEAIITSNEIRLRISTVDGVKTKTYRFRVLEVITTTELIPNEGDLEVKALKPRDADFPVFIFRSQEMIEKLEASMPDIMPRAQRLLIRVSELGGSEIALYSPGQIKSGFCAAALSMISNDGFRVREFPG